MDTPEKHVVAYQITVIEASDGIYLLAGWTEQSHYIAVALAFRQIAETFHATTQLTSAVFP